MSDTSIDNLLNEQRFFAPPSQFRQQATLSDEDLYKAMYEQSVQQPELFWAQQAEANLHWHSPFKQVLEWKPPFAKWFQDGSLNVSYNCLDRHVEAGLGDKPALVFEGEPGDRQTFTYSQLLQEVSRLANYLQSCGLQAGERVLIYMPMIPQGVMAMLACARLGLIHSVVFGGFSSESIKDRLLDCDASFVITADGGWRRGQIVELKANIDEALQQCSRQLKGVLVYQRCGNTVGMQQGRDVWWHEALQHMPAQHLAEAFNAEHPLFILYTSGSTGKPKGILHSSGGYLLGSMLTFKYIFDIKPQDLYWCTADIGWITGHSYICYGPLANGASVFMYEGAPNYPDFSRFWRMIEEYRISIFYTAPTAIRAFIKAGDSYVLKHDLSSLRLLGSVGEPINPEAWMWYHRMIGQQRCPIVDTWWQTETGAIMIAPMPGITHTQPGTATHAFFGVDAAIVDESGQQCDANHGGRLVIRKPWPSMLRGIWGDNERYAATYWSDFAGIYCAGDGARCDEHGNFWIVGRLDDVLNVAGHRLGTAEVESSLVSHAAVAEAAVIGRADEIKGQAVVAFVTLKEGFESSGDLEKALREHVAKSIGAIAKPDDVHIVAALPKTRSGKIMRRLLKELAATGSVSGNITTLDDVSVIENLARQLAGAGK